MKNFSYLQPESLAEASGLARQFPADAMLYAGGTDLLGLLKDGILSPAKVINLKAIAGLDCVEYARGKGLRIGALTPLATIAEHPLIMQQFTALAQAAARVGTPQLRNMGTIGGNLCQRPRCSYFRGEFACLRKGGGTCFAVDGQNQQHCIVGGDSCYMVHPSDTAVALLALDAQITIFNGKKQCSVPVSEFYVLPGQDYRRETILRAGDIVSEILIPEAPEGSVSGYVKFTERNASEFAIVSVACAAQKTNGRIKSGRVALGGVAPIPWFEKTVSSLLCDLPADPEKIAAIASKALIGAEPLELNACKIPLTRNLLKRLLHQLLAA